MKPVYLAALLSFLIGFCGYTIIRYWLIPIFRYQKLKRQIWRLISSMGPTRAEQSEACRRLAAQLAECAGRDLPNWYHIHLRAKGLDPLAAVPHLTTLAHIENIEHRNRRIAEIHALIGGRTGQSE